MEGKVRTALIASGSGTDANAIMRAYAAGKISNIELVCLVSTKEGAGCLEKAAAVNKEFGLKIESIVIDRKASGSEDNFNDNLESCLLVREIELIILVGCVVRIRTDIRGAKYNIHPADPYDFGGKGYYGLVPHTKVLENVLDIIRRGQKKASDHFYTYPTVHEVTEEFDSGKRCLRNKVEIPVVIIRDLLEEKIPIEEAAKRLQQHVLPFEWKMLPLAVRMAAQKILDKRRMSSTNS